MLSEILDEVVGQRFRIANYQGNIKSRCLKRRFPVCDNMAPLRAWVSPLLVQIIQDGPVCRRPL